MRDSSHSGVLQLLCDVSVDAMLIINENGFIVTLNRAALTLFGYERWELVGRNVKILMEAKYAKRHDAFLARYRRTLVKRVIGETRGNLHGLRKDGSLFPMILKAHEVCCVCFVVLCCVVLCFSFFLFFENQLTLNCSITTVRSIDRLLK